MTASLLGELTQAPAAAGYEHAAQDARRILTAAQAAAPAQAHALAREMAQRVANGEPLAYVTGCQIFMGIELLSAPGALVPREETELLGQTALADRGSLAQGGLFTPLAGLGLEASIDLIVCNPPYISQGRLAGDRAELLTHEPREAFDGGPYGMSIHQRVIKDAWSFLQPGGQRMFQFGLGQERQLKLLFNRAKSYEVLEFVANQAGQARVAVARKPRSDQVIAGEHHRWLPNRFANSSSRISTSRRPTS